MWSLVRGVWDTIKGRRLRVNSPLVVAHEGPGDISTYFTPVITAFCLVIVNNNRLVEFITKFDNDYLSFYTITERTRTAMENYDTLIILNYI